MTKDSAPSEKSKNTPNTTDGPGENVDKKARELEDKKRRESQQSKEVQ